MDAPDPVCEFIATGLAMFWCADISAANEHPLLFKLFGHFHNDVRTEAMKHAIQLAGSPESQQALVRSGVFEALLGLLDEVRPDIRDFVTAKMLPLLAIAIGRSGGLEDLQRLLCHDTEDVVDGACAAITRIADADLSDRQSLVTARLLASLLSTVTLDSYSSLLNLVNHLTTRLPTQLLAAGDGELLFQALGYPFTYIGS